MRLLRILPSLDPRGGGPIEAARTIDIELQRCGHPVELICLDEPGSEFLAAYPAQVHALGSSLAGYRFSPKLVPWLRANRVRFDAVIVDGLWQYHAFGAWRALAGTDTPYLVFTHGMLDPWFKRTYPLKHLKKWMYWPWAEYRVLRDAATVIFTCEEERRLARESFWLYRVNEAVATLGTSDVPAAKAGLAAGFVAAYPELAGKRLAVYLSRIHEKKGCDLLIEAFARVSAGDTNLHLVMAGPDQTGWVARLKALAEDRGIADRITWPGMLSGDMKWGAFHAAEVFCLPSHQENFGIVVAEALACGTPVLISNKVNIWREISTDGAGFVQPDTLEGTATALRQWLNLSPDELTAMRRAARDCFDSRFRIEKVAEDLLRIISSHVPEISKAAAPGHLS